MPGSSGHVLSSRRSIPSRDLLPAPPRIDHGRASCQYWGMKARSQNYQEKVAALEVVKPTLERLALWSPQCAYISGIASAGKGDFAAVCSHTRNLLEDIARERSTLEGLIAAQPEAIRNHGRVQDALRSLDALTANLTGALGSLEP